MAFTMKPFGFAATARRAAKAALLGVALERLTRETALGLERDIKLRIRAYPIWRTGLYAGSWTTTFLGDSYKVASNVEYGPFQEWGTGRLGAMTHETILPDERPGSFDTTRQGMTARPHVRPAIAAAEPVYRAKADALVRKAVA